MADYDGYIGMKKFASDLIKLANERIDEYTEKAAYIAGVEIQKVARDLSPVDQGDLRKSIQVGVSRIGQSISSVIAPKVKYAAGVEFGQPPGTRVSPAKLAGWAGRRGLNPYAIAKGIERKGTKAQPFLFPAFDEKQESVFLIISQGIDNALNSLGK